MANALIFENGAELASSQRFARQPQLVTAELDVERLQNERAGNTSFRTDSALATEFSYEVIDLHQPVAAVTRLTRRVDPVPFVPSGTELDQHCEEIFNIQVTGLATRL